MAASPSPFSGLAYRNNAYGLSYHKAVEINWDDTDLSRDITTPANTLLLNVWVTVLTLFNSGTSDLLNIGWSDDLDGLVDDASVASGGAFVAGDTIGLMFHAPATAILGDDLTDTATTNVMRKANGIYKTAEDTITVSITKSGTAATAGRAIVVLELLSLETGEIDMDS